MIKVKVRSFEDHVKEKLFFTYILLLLLFIMNMSHCGDLRDIKKEIEETKKACQVSTE